MTDKETILFLIDELSRKQNELQQICSDICYIRTQLLKLDVIKEKTCNSGQPQL